MKKCTQCKLEKDISKFSPKGNGKFASQCKDCKNKIKRDKYIKKGKNILLDIENNIKQCIVCLEFKPIKDFYLNKNSKGILTSRRNDCKLCIIFKNKIRYKNHRQLIWEYLKQHPCIDCGENDPIVLEFDHINNKFEQISTMMSKGFNIDKIFLEISKCEVRCANCHRRKTAIQLDWYKNINK